MSKKKRLLIVLIVILFLFIIVGGSIVFFFVFNKHTHNFSSEWSKDGTHHWQACSGCDEVRNKSEHDWNAGVITSQPTEGSEEIRTVSCNVCGQTKIESIPSLADHEHSYSNDWASDVTHHWRTATCEHITERTDYAEHTWDNGSITIAATHMEEGEMRYACIVCKRTRVEKIEKSPKHSYSAWEFNDSFTHKRTCACGDIQTENHHWNGGVVTTQPTDDNEGTKTYTCFDCGSTKEESISASTTFTVQFRDYDGSVLSEQTVSLGADAETPIEPYREGYRFDGWDKDHTNVQGDLIINAVYVKVYEVRFVDYDGSIHDLQIVDEGKNAIRPETDPSRVNYRFDKWDKDFSNITEDLTVNAVYVRQYGVTFVDYDGTVLLERQLVDVNGTAIAPDEPTRIGFTFTGWDTPFDHITAEAVITAIYEINTYTVIFLDGNKVPLGPPQTIRHGFSAEEPDNCPETWFDWSSSKMKGYYFTGWSADFKEIFEDTVITAIYEEEITTPVLAAENVVVKSGDTSTVEVSLYICSSEPICGLKLDLSYAQRLILTESNVRVRSPYNGKNSYSLKVDSENRIFSFSWSNGNGVVPDRYEAVLTITFEIDRRIPEGEYPIEFLGDVYYVSGDLVKLVPVVFDGKVTITQ